MISWGNIEGDTKTASENHLQVVYNIPITLWCKIIMFEKNNHKCLRHGPLGPNSIESCPNSSRRVRCRTSTGRGRGNNWLAKNGCDQLFNDMFKYTLNLCQMLTLDSEMNYGTLAHLSLITIRKNNCKCQLLMRYWTIM